MVTGVGFDKVCRLHILAISGSLICICMRCLAELPPSDDVSECVCFVVRAYDWESECTRIFRSNLKTTDRVGAVVGLIRVCTRTFSIFFAFY